MATSSQSGGVTRFPPLVVGTNPETVEKNFTSFFIYLRLLFRPSLVSSVFYAAIATPRSVDADVDADVDVAAVERPPARATTPEDAGMLRRLVNVAFVVALLLLLLLLLALKSGWKVRLGRLRFDSTT